MAKIKYGDNIKTLSFKEGNGFYRQVAEMTGELLGYDIHIEYGAYCAAGKMGKEPHKTVKHDYDQVMLWMGTDMSDPGELGAEVELILGEEGEKHMIASSQIVFIPKNLPHFPATITKMDRRFIFMTISLAADPEATPVTLKKVASEPAGWMDAKHRDKILHIPFERKGPWHYGPQNRDDAGGAIANINAKDFVFNMSYESIRKAPYRFGPIPDKPHVHPYTEFLLFMGADPDDLTELGGEAELYMGKEMEKHVINKPTIAVQPQGFHHCPLVVTRLEKPFIFSVLRPWGHGAEDSRRVP